MCKENKKNMKNSSKPNFPGKRHSFANSLYKGNIDNKFLTVSLHYIKLLCVGILYCSYML